MFVLMSEKAEKILQALSIPCLRKVPAGRLTTMQSGGAAELTAEPQTKEALCNLLQALCEAEIPYVVLGGGSNVLLDDRGYHGVLIRTLRLQEITLTRTTVTADAGVTLPRLARTLAQAGLGGLEFVCGIPGTIGGAIRMNAGAHGSTVSDVITSCLCRLPREGRTVSYSKEEMAFSHRQSRISHTDAVLLSATFSLSKSDPAELLSHMQRLLQKRRETQPVGERSAGSVFCRLPDGTPVSRLLDQAGCKGMIQGGAKISEKHAGFIVNFDHATTEDVRILVQRASAVLEKRFGISPTPEILFLPSE